MKWITTDQGFSEIFTPAGVPRPHCGALVSSLESFTRTEIDRRERLQTLSLMSQGVTFTVYGEKEGLERIFPFDFVPRIIPPRAEDDPGRPGPAHHRAQPSSMRIAPATSRWPTRRVRAWRMTRPSTPSCPSSSSTIF